MEFSDSKIIKCTPRSVNNTPDSVDLTIEIPDGTQKFITVTVTQSDGVYICGLMNLKMESK